LVWVDYVYDCWGKMFFKNVFLRYLGKGRVKLDWSRVFGNLMDQFNFFDRGDVARLQKFGNLFSE
jgi:hypothetical protein